MSSCDAPSRRDFFRMTGAAGSALAVGPVFGRLGAAAEARPEADRRKALFSLGLASYTLRKFDLDETLAMTRRVGLTHLCLKSFHLPLDATAEQISAAVAKVKQAELDLYGCGVVSMKTDQDVNQAFDYARAAGMRTIVAAPLPELLPLLNEKVKQSGLEVAIHNHGPGDKIYPTPESIYRKVEKFDQRIGLCIDVGHTARIGADPIADVERFADRLLDLHVKDVSAAAAEGKTVEIGRGVLDIPALLRALLKINYSRVASFEHEKDERDPLAGLAESVGYIRGALAAIG
ncbi:MAG: sugar phosphate isomerase/epimerase [Candidatus Anammoximicrobium sp.]|nr:sugar phosphate isomerase/epimerase [Candidatus Anammoximicrobium sp.]